MTPPLLDSLQNPTTRIDNALEEILKPPVDDLLGEAAVVEEIPLLDDASPVDTQGEKVDVSGLMSLATDYMAVTLNEIVGTGSANDITGTALPDYILGRAGDDTIRGGDGNDIVIGGAGNDIISGDHAPAQTTQSNDKIYGNGGNDKLFGRIGDDLLFGGQGDDQLFGGSASDRLFGGNGNDQLFGGIVSGEQSLNPHPDGKDRLVGGRGNDILDGGDGNDALLGTNSNAKGLGEFDSLTGGSGRDTFVLGNKAAAFYTQGGAMQDFAFIRDFAVADDKVRLHGNASQYVLGFDGANTTLSYLPGGNPELIGVFEGQDFSGLSLTSNSFKYVA